VPSVIPIVKAVQAAIDGTSRALNISGIGETVH